MALHAPEPPAATQAERQRLRASHNLLSLGLLCMFAVLQHVEVLMGLIDETESNWLSAFSIGTSLVFQLLIRSGLNLRIAPADPSMTLAQSLFAVTALVWSYAITGPARGSLLAILVLAILFGGMLQLRPNQTRGLVLYALLGMSAVMVWRTQWAEQRYDAQVEFVQLAFAMIVLAGAAMLANRVGSMRARLSRQKAELAKALELSRHLATRDALTGLLNRRAMMEVLSLKGPRPQTKETRTALAMLDIDHFKRINDGHGHQVGDAVLQRFAEQARAGLRGGDVLARWGGEEFLLLMPHTSPADAALLLQRLRSLLAQAGFADLAPDLAVSFSAGLTEIGTGEDHEVAIARADQALYRAKREGRDRVVSA